MADLIKSVALFVAGAATATATIAILSNTGILDGCLCNPDSGSDKASDGNNKPDNSGKPGKENNPEKTDNQDKSENSDTGGNKENSPKSDTDEEDFSDDPYHDYCGECNGC